jgi:putative aldouronate transport system substrate-binding protein
MMASGDYPDAFIGGWGGGNTNIIRYGIEEDVYIPMTDMLKDHAPNFMANAPKITPNILQILTAPDGNIYSLPEVGGDPAMNVIPTGFFINQEWLTKLGLQMPTTIDEFEAVLRAFKTRDPNGNGRADEIPWSFGYNSWEGYNLASHFGSFGYCVQFGDFLVIDRDQVVFTAATDGFKAGAQWLAKLYKDGLIDREAVSQPDSSMLAKITLPEMTIGAFNAYARTYAEDNFSKYAPVLPLKGPDGAQNWFKNANYVQGRDTFIITSKAKNPEILLRTVDYMYKDFETGFSCTYGIGPDPNKYWNYDSAGKIALNPNPPPEYSRTQQGLPFFPSQMEPQEYVRILSTGGEYGKMSGIYQEKKELLDLYEPYTGKYNSGEWKPYPGVLFSTAAENEDLSILQTEIVAYAKGRLARWISGEGSVDSEWNAYLNELRDMGLDNYIKMKQAIYDRSIGKQ